MLFRLFKVWEESHRCDEFLKVTHLTICGIPELPLAAIQMRLSSMANLCKDIRSEERF